MVSSRAEPSGNNRALQAGVMHWCRLRKAVAALSALLLSGCASAPAAINPVDWYHDLEGGPIAAKRAPPPGANAPYPNLANVPPRPHVVSAAERDRITAALLTDRTRANQQAVLAPLPSSAPSAPAQAASGSQPPAAAPLAVPPPAVSPASLSPPRSGSAPPASSFAAGASRPAATPTATLAAAAAAMPAVPAAPPPPPAIAGYAPPGHPPAPLTAGRPARWTLRFPAGSAALPSAERARLDHIAAERGNASIAVIGYGDGAASDAAAQWTALHLGLARAKTVAAALEAAGVPAAALRLEAQASGNGAALRLLD